MGEREEEVFSPSPLSQQLLIKSRERIILIGFKSDNETDINLIQYLVDS